MGGVQRKRGAIYAEKTSFRMAPNTPKGCREIGALVWVWQPQELGRPKWPACRKGVSGQSQAALPKVGVTQGTTEEPDILQSKPGPSCLRAGDSIPAPDGQFAKLISNILFGLRFDKNH